MVCNNVSVEGLEVYTGLHDPSDLGTKNIGLTNPVPSSGTLDSSFGLQVLHFVCQNLHSVLVESESRGKGVDWGVVRNWSL